MTQGHTDHIGHWANRESVVAAGKGSGTVNAKRCGQDDHTRLKDSAGKVSSEVGKE